MGSFHTARNHFGHTAVIGKKACRRSDPISRSLAGDELQVVLNRTPFYAEGGGQIADSGVLRSLPAADNGSEPAVIRVSDVQKAAGGSLYVHSAILESGRLEVGQEVAVLLPRAIPKSQRPLGFPIRSSAMFHSLPLYLLLESPRWGEAGGPDLHPKEIKITGFFSYPKPLCIPIHS